MSREPAFDVVLTEAVTPGETLLVGVAGVGIAGLTAADYLVTHVETTQIGHVRARNLPDTVPFSAGEPRHPIRLYSTVDSDVTVLISEVFVPVGVAGRFVETLVEWATRHRLEEATVLYGAPFPHSETEHAVFHVSTPAYRRRTLDESGVKPLAGGFFDGVVGELLTRSLDEEFPPTGVLVTPTHPPGPDLNAALRLLDAVESVHGIVIDEAELRSRVEEMEQYYRELDERMQALQEGQHSDQQEYPDDRMFM